MREHVVTTELARKRARAECKADQPKGTPTDLSRERTKTCVPTQTGSVQVSFSALEKKRSVSLRAAASRTNLPISPSSAAQVQRRCTLVRSMIRTCLEVLGTASKLALFFSYAASTCGE